MSGLIPFSDLPSVARFNLLDQPGENRSIAHLLYAPITLRAQKKFWNERKPLEIIEELIPLHDTTVTIRVPQTIAAATLEPEGAALPFTQTGDKVTFTVPEFTGHQMVALAWG